MNLGAKPFPLERLSPSSLGCFAGCPEQFRQKYLLKKPDKTFGDMFMGSVNHETIAALLGVKKIRPLPDGDELRELVRGTYMHAWETKLADDGEPDWKEEDSVEQYTRGLMMALAYIEGAFPNITPVAIEERVEIKIPRIPLIRGYVDVIEPDKFRERKTTAAKQTSPKPTWRFQARVYQFILGMPVQWDVITRQVTPKLYMADEWPELKMATSNREVTLHLIRDLYWRMNDLWQRRGRESPWPLDGYQHPWLCSRCPIGPRYASTCGVWS